MFFSYCFILLLRHWYLKSMSSQTFQPFLKFCLQKYEQVCIKKNLFFLLKHHVLVCGVKVKLVSHWDQKIVYTKNLQLFCRRRIYVLTGLKVLSLQCKCVFYRQKHMERGNPWNWNLKVSKCQNEIYQ